MGTICGAMTPIDLSTRVPLVASTNEEPSDSSSERRATVNVRCANVTFAPAMEKTLLGSAEVAVHVENVHAIFVQNANYVQPFLTNRTVL